ncbi:hypothetical protein GALL_323030 [mine drainage metagenome]|uniref:Uncharacterized protein n=1 Tax=mine drainage metagenome TaxID=410659 RepID=A0A1J5RCJ4_9ZZZZ
MNKKKLSVAALAIALSVGTVSSATANQGQATIDGPRVGSLQLTAVLSSLVTAGTITQAQSDAITNALASARTTRVNTMSTERNARLNLIASTLGMDAATVQSKLRTGISLASLAGDKTGVLITALVNLESQQIDAAVAAGRMTATQAAAKKANLVAEETREVNATRHANMRGAAASGSALMGTFGHTNRGHGERMNFMRSSR